MFSFDKETLSINYLFHIRLKLFNLLLEELGPRFLLHGILLSWQQLHDLFPSQSQGFRPSSCRLDGSPVAADDWLRLGESDPSGELVEVKVYFSEQEP